MDRSLTSPDDLAEEALKVGPEEFIGLIEDVGRILLDEARGISRGDGFKVVGRLVYLPTSGEAFVIGDLHGDLKSLTLILRGSDLPRRLLRENVYLIFLGDYGDRGLFSPEVYYVVLTLKRMFPKRVVLLRGNHEGPRDLLAHPHDLPYYLEKKFQGSGREIYGRLTELFDYLHLAVLVEGRYVMLHGGVPSEAENVDDVAYAHLKHPEESHLEEILWSDPVEGVRGTLFSPRGAGRLFGPDVTERFLKIVGARLLIRGHEPSEEGFKMNHSGKVLTLFSRRGPPYYNSAGAYLHLDLSEEVGEPKEIIRRVHKF